MLECTVCKAVFATESDRSEHVRNIHQPDVKIGSLRIARRPGLYPWLCKWCKVPKWFKKTRTFRNHVRGHDSHPDTRHISTPEPPSVDSDAPSEDGRSDVPSEDIDDGQSLPPSPAGSGPLPLVDMENPPAPPVSPLVNGKDTPPTDTPVEKPLQFPFIFYPEMPDTSILYDKDLAPFNLVLHTSLHVLICRECGIGLTTDHVLGHMDNKHAGRYSRSELTALDDRVKVLHGGLDRSTTGSYDPSPPFPTQPISYIKIHSGFVCTSTLNSTPCHYAAEKEETLKVHFKKAHGGNPAFSAKPSPIQTLWGGNRRGYFPVFIPEKIPDGGRALWEMMTLANDAMIRERSLFKVSDIHRQPFFQKYRWIEIFEKFDKKSLRELVRAETKEGDKLEEAVKKAVKTYVERGNKKLCEGELHSYIRKRLSVKDPEEGSTSDFCYIQNIDNYSIVLVKCVLAIVRHILWFQGFGCDTTPPDSRFMFYFTPKQAELGKAFLNAAKECGDQEILIPILHDFLYELISDIHPIVRKDSYSCTFTRLIMLLQLTEEGHFKDPRNFSGSIAALQYCFRQVMLKEIEKRATEAALVSDSLIDYVTPCNEVVDWCTDKLKMSPWSQVQLWLSILHPIAQDALGEERFVWTRDRKSYIYKGELLTIDGWGKWFQDLTTRLETLVKEEIFLGLDVKIKLPEIVHDDIGNRLAGYSWVSDARNRHFTGKYGLSWFFKNVILSMKYSEPLYDFTDKKTPRLERWLRMYKLCKVYIATLLKLACSSSIRDTEQLAILIREAPYCRRSFYFIKSDLICVPYTEKVAYTRKNPDPVPHPVYDRLTNVIVALTLCAQPFEELVRWRDSDKSVWALTKDLYFAEEKGTYEPTVISSFIKEETKERFKLALGSREMRHNIHCIMMETCPTHFLTTGYNNFIARSAHHSARTADRVYGRVQAIGSMDAQEMVQLLAVGRHLHKVWGLGPGNDPDLYPLPSDFGPHQAQTRVVVREGPVEASLTQESHNALLRDFNAAAQRLIALAKGPVSTSGSIGSVDNRPIPPPSMAGIRHMRKTLGDDNAVFRSVGQCVVLDQLISPTGSYCFVMPTGSGKTLMYILAGRYLQTYSFGNLFMLIVVPFRHLVNDVMERCKRHQVAATLLEYESDGTPSGMMARFSSPILVVSADKFARSDTIEEFLKASRLAGRLHSIVFDEAHTVLEPRRRNLLALPERIVRIGAPVFLNSGSVTAGDEARLREMFGVLDLKVVREPTVRPNISYYVHPLKKGSVASSVRLMINKFRSWSPTIGPFKILVFVRTRALAEAYARELKGLPFHRGLGEEDLLKNASLFKDRNSSVDLLCCTTAFGVGVDIPNIRFCIHVGSPYSITGYYQESGRIGRDGIASQAHIVYDVNNDGQNAVRLKGTDKIYDYLRARDECLRGLLTSQFDALPSCCHSCPGLEACQFCYKASHPPPAIDPAANNQEPPAPPPPASPQDNNQDPPAPPPPTSPHKKDSSSTAAPAPPSAPAGSSSANKLPATTQPLQPTILVPGTPPVQPDLDAHKSLGEKRTLEEDTDDEIQPRHSRRRLVVKSQTPVPSSQTQERPKPMEVDPGGEDAPSPREHQERARSQGQNTRAVQPAARGLCVETFLAKFPAPDGAESGAKTSSSLLSFSPLSVQELEEEEKRRELAEEEEFKREIRAQRKNLADVDKLRDWQRLKSFMDDNKGKCWWCMRDPIAEGRCSSPNAFECQIRSDPTKSREFDLWKNYLGSTYNDHQQRPNMSKYSNNNCARCYLPSATPGHKVTEKSRCGLGDNVRATVFLIMESRWWRSQFTRLYPEAYNADQPRCREARDWMMRDLNKCGDSGIVRILDWWFVFVCKRTV